VAKWEMRGAGGAAAGWGLLRARESAIGGSPEVATRAVSVLPGFGFGIGGVGGGAATLLSSWTENFRLVVLFWLRISERGWRDKGRRRWFVVAAAIYELRFGPPLKQVSGLARH
jgi:hypothetical protein